MSLSSAAIIRTYVSIPVRPLSLAPLQRSSQHSIGGCGRHELISQARLLDTREVFFQTDVASQS